MSETPLMKQYREVKKEYADCVLFFRMGDFYELFDDDAVLASRVLGITLTSRNNGASGKTPLCGFPHHASERYVPRMIRAGYKVAICEQVEDPKEAKGIVKREVVEVITAGTSMSDAVLDAKTGNYLAAVIPHGIRGSNTALATLDVSTGRFLLQLGNLEDARLELFRIHPSEVLLPDEAVLEKLRAELDFEIDLPVSAPPTESATAAKASELLCKQLGVQSPEALGLQAGGPGVLAASAVLAYALDQKKSALKHVNRLEITSLDDYMLLDPPTMRSLEILRPMAGEDENATLLHVLDHTATAMGGRLLKWWLCHPLLSPEKITRRQDAVSEFIESPVLQEDLRGILREIHDIERLSGRVGSGRANGRDLLSLGRSLLRCEELSTLLSGLASPAFAELGDQLKGLGDRAREILETIHENAPLTVREGGLIRAGASEELDALNEGIRDAREWLSGLESRERKSTGIPKLKVGFNKVFGYFIEVTKSYQDKVPESYIRKQTLVNCERYITPEMKEFEARILSAESCINSLEYDIFTTLRSVVAEWIVPLRDAAEAVAKADCLQSLGSAARKHGFFRPEIFEDTRLEIHGAWHPVIKALNPTMPFITNDLETGPDSRQILLITGPNMAGKSTYLRQNGLLVLMAQTGSFVPAESARVGIADRIFTRVGAQDRLARGQSTFMVEMVETANILRNASPRSLILLDEIGRGTSTFDGLALAWSIVESLHENPERAGRCLFATHYHELTVLADELARLENFHITVKQKDGQLLFLRKIEPGACDSSYGIQVAHMAGVPDSVIHRARKILLRLEQNRTVPSDELFLQPESPPQQDLFETPTVSEDEQLALQDLRSARLDEMTPLDALNLLHKIRQNLTS